MLRIIVLLAVMAPVVVQQAGCCAVKKTCCVEGTVLTKPTRWRSYFDFCIDTGCGEKKISIKGSGRAPYNALIDRGRYVSISGINKEALDNYVIQLQEEEVDIKVSLIK